MKYIIAIIQPDRMNEILRNFHLVTHPLWAEGGKKV